MHLSLLLSIPLPDVLCSLLNFFAVKYYGGTCQNSVECWIVALTPIMTESEFWLALGKALLITGLIAFTFVTMVGGNPLHDAYGFRYWNRK